jgi:MFS family permease
VMTPLHMHHGNASLNIIGFVISVHVLGMFAFSPLVGWLTDRVGRAAVLTAGGGLLLGAVTLSGLAPEGHSTGLVAGLFLLGLGWSCCLIAGSALLVDAVPFAERPGVQGASDLVMGLFAAGGGALAGVVVETLGYAVLNLGSGLLALVVLAAAAVARRSGRPSEEGM